MQLINKNILKSNEDKFENISKKFENTLQLKETQDQTQLSSENPVKSNEAKFEDILKKFEDISKKFEDISKKFENILQLKETQGQMLLSIKNLIKSNKSHASQLSLVAAQLKKLTAPLTHSGTQIDEQVPREPKELSTTQHSKAQTNIGSLTDVTIGKSNETEVNEN